MGVPAAVGATNEVAANGGSRLQSASNEIDPPGVHGQEGGVARDKTWVGIMEPTNFAR